jgi:predicted membrane protein
MTEPMKSPGTNEASIASAGAMRGVSFAAALAATLVLMVFPFVLRGVPDVRLHSALPVVMSGIASAFVYGIGFTPDNRLLQMLFRPWCSWTLMVAGASVLAL